MPIGLRLIHLTSQFLDQSANTFFYYDALALHLLGYQIPAMAKVLPTLSPYQFVAAK